LTYQVEAEAVVWRLVDESEPGGKVEMTRSCKRVIGPEHQSAVTGRTREVNAGLNQTATQPLATAGAAD